MLFREIISVYCENQLHCVGKLERF
jgi:hypothetical protein